MKIRKDGDEMDMLFILIGIFTISCIVYAIMKAGDN